MQVIGGLLAGEGAAAGGAGAAGLGAEAAAGAAPGAIPAISGVAAPAAMGAAAGPSIGATALNALAGTGQAIGHGLSQFGNFLTQSALPQAANVAGRLGHGLMMANELAGGRFPQFMAMQSAMGQDAGMRALLGDSPFMAGLTGGYGLQPGAGMPGELARAGLPTGQAGVSALGNRGVEVLGESPTFGGTGIPGSSPMVPQLPPLTPASQLAQTKDQILRDALQKLQSGGELSDAEASLTGIKQNPLQQIGKVLEKINQFRRPGQKPGSNPFPEGSRISANGIIIPLNPPPRPGTLPAGMEPFADPETGYTYYYNETGDRIPLQRMPTPQRPFATQFKWDPSGAPGIFDPNTGQYTPTGGPIPKAPSAVSKIKIAQTLTQFREENPTPNATSIATLQQMLDGLGINYPAEKLVDPKGNKGWVWDAPGFDWEHFDTLFQDAGQLSTDKLNELRGLQ